MKQFKTFMKTTVGRKPQSEAGGQSKTADVSKEELRAELKKHEERETPAQEKAESKEEQKVEREAGVEKGAAMKKLADGVTSAAQAVMAGAFGGKSTPAPTPAPADVAPTPGFAASVTSGLNHLMGR